MYVMTPYTSLCWLEKEAMYKQFNVDRGRKDHWAMYPCPAKIPVVYIPDPNQPAGSRPDLKGQKPHENQVLQTIMVRTPPPFLAWPGHGGGDTAIMTAGQRYGSAFAVTNLESEELDGERGDDRGTALGAVRELDEKALRFKKHFSESKAEKLVKQLEVLDRRERWLEAKPRARLGRNAGFGGRQAVRLAAREEAAAVPAPVVSSPPLPTLEWAQSSDNFFVETLGDKIAGKQMFRRGRW